MTRRGAPPIPISHFADWYGSPAGQALVTLEQDCVERLLRETFGYYLVQIGLTAGLGEALGASRIRHQIRLEDGALPAPRTAAAQLLADPAGLPLATDSIDAVLLPHTLDFAGDPRAVLREVERVLIPEGRLILLGFNALSPWALWGLARCLGITPPAPWRGRFLDPYRVGAWLDALGFDIERHEYLRYRLPFQHARYGQILGPVYALRAVKRVATLMPLRPFWKWRRLLLPGRLVRPSTRGSTHV